MIRTWMAGLVCMASSAMAVVPNPNEMRPGPGAFVFGEATVITVPPGDAEARQAATRLASLMKRAHGLNLVVKEGRARKGAIRLVRGAEAGEAHAVSVTPARIELRAGSAVGWQHASATLWQLTEKVAGRTRVAAVEIADAPRFAWRGLMLDSARHFQPKAFVKDYLDWMALHKLNVLHWHLTDDQGWRIEIDKYPKLTAVGAFRVPAGRAAQRDIDPATGKPRLYGGFYTKQDIREVVAHAAALGITIVPEIEMPGHATVVLAAYPEFGATGEVPKESLSDWGIFHNAYGVGDKTFAFLEDVLTEVMALFPGKYIHVGGDEVEKSQWKTSPAAQARMKELNLTEVKELQVYFTQRIGRFLEKHGRRLVGWDEILEPGLPPGAVVMSWRGIDGALAAAAKGHDTILSPWPTLYFDNRQSGAADEPPGRGKVLSLAEVYGFEPMPPTIAAERRHHVLGLQGNVWTEHIRTPLRAAHMTFPRAAAIAELGWSQPARRGWPDFARRAARLVSQYPAAGVAHADSAFAVAAERVHAGDRVKVTLATQAGQGEIRYTTDGSLPTARSPQYRGVLDLPARGELKAATFLGEARLAATRTFALAPAQRRKSQELMLCTEHIPLSLEDDGPTGGPRAAMLVDIQNPCWLWRGADLSQPVSLHATVGQLPFNFQIGEDWKKVKFAAPQTPEGELVVKAGGCEGAEIARIPLATAADRDGTTALPPAPLPARPGRQDLCLQFAQRFADPARDPIWAIDALELK